jgi:hypothetical protein
MSEHETDWNKSAFDCPECGGECLTDGNTLSCIECPFETESDSMQGYRLIEQYYDEEEL